MIYILTQYGAVFTASTTELGIKTYVALHALPPHLYSEYRVMLVNAGGEVAGFKPLKEFME